MLHTEVFNSCTSVCYHIVRHDQHYSKAASCRECLQWCCIGEKFEERERERERCTSDIIKLLMYLSALTIPGKANTLCSLSIWLVKVASSLNSGKCLKSTVTCSHAYTLPLKGNDHWSLKSPLYNNASRSLKMDYFYSAHTQQTDYLPSNPHPLYK